VNAITQQPMRLSNAQQPVLVVDDDHDFADSIIDLLEVSGYSSIPAYSAKQALAIAGRQQIDVALIDIRLGQDSGVDLVGQLQQLHPKMLCVMVTGYASLETAVLALKQGAYDYLYKPFNSESLLLSLQRVFEHLDAQQQKERFHKTLRLYEKILASTSELMAFVDQRYIFQAVNEAYLQTYGQQREAIIGSSLTQVHGAMLFQNFLQPAVDWCLAGNSSKQQRWLQLPHTDRRCYMDVGFYPYRDEPNGEVSGVVLSWRDLTETMLLSEKLSYQATHDALTGLYNRFEFERCLYETIDTARRNNTEHVLCYIDLDQFKIVNDSCGHAAGDELLRQLGHLLKQAIREDDILARLGGDEFGLLLKGCRPEQAQRVTAKLLELLSQYSFGCEGKTFGISASIGMVAVDHESDSAGGVLRIADSACYVAKDAGGNRVHLYHSDDAQFAHRRSEMRWVTVLKESLQGNSHLLLVQQPIIPLAEDNGGLHYEILLRIQDPETAELVSPGVFLSAAERYKLSPLLDRWVIDTVFRLLAAHPAHLPALSLCTINLSGLSLSDEGFLEHLREALQTSGLAPEKLCFEITETAAIANLNTANRFIWALRDQGCRFALDDFGSGFCSFGYLKNLPVDFIKIDGMFIKNIDRDPVDATMVRAINDIAHKLGKKTIAEFVENERILAKLKTIGIDYAQGYELGRPASLTQLLSQSEQ